MSETAMSESSWGIAYLKGYLPYSGCIEWPVTERNDQHRLVLLANSLGSFWDCRVNKSHARTSKHFRLLSFIIHVNNLCTGGSWALIPRERGDFFDAQERFKVRCPSCQHRRLSAIQTHGSLRPHKPNKSRQLPRTSKHIGMKSIFIHDWCFYF